MSLNLQPERTDPTSILGNQRAIDRHLTWDHYTLNFTPGIFVPNGTTLIGVHAASMRYPAITFAKAAASEALVSFAKPSEWRSGKLAITVLYTSPGASTNNFYVAITVDAVKTGEVLTGTNLYAVFSTWAGPAVANTVKKLGPIYTTNTIGADDELFGLKVRRDSTHANDTNVNDLNVLMVRVVHMPARVEGQ